LVNEIDSSNLYNTFFKHILKEETNEEEPDLDEEMPEVAYFESDELKRTRDYITYLKVSVV